MVISCLYWLFRHLLALIVLRCRSEAEVFRSEAIQIIRTPVRAPRANAYIGSIRRECLDRLVILNRRHLEQVLPAYIRHYNAHRPHRSLNRRPPDPASPSPDPLPTLTASDAETSSEG